MNPNPASKVSSRHDLNNAALGAWLVQNGSIPHLKLPLVSTKIGYGQSNPTYFVDDANGLRVILRKKPSGTIISPVAHQVDREYRVLAALGRVPGFPVPKVYALCMDASIIGTAFYVMEFVRGRIITEPDLASLPREQRRAAWFSLVETLAWMHSIDPDAIGLEGFGKKTGFYARHCNTFSRIEAQQAKVKDKDTGRELGRAHEDFDEVVAHVRRNLPSDRHAIVHGDYKFDNVILHPTEPRVIAILDWELSTVGHPLMDAVYAVAPFWNQATGPRGAQPQPEPKEPSSIVASSAYAAENREAWGLPDPDELMDRYAQITGWDPRRENGGRDWKIGMIFHFVRGGTISHGIQARTISGQASSEFSHVYFANTRRSFDAAVARVKAMKERDGERSRL